MTDPVMKLAGGPAPIDMVLHCPACGLQHVDEPDTDAHAYSDGRESMWTNPPHRSHLCHGCGHIWRPADVPTNGVAAIKTRGQNDSPIVQPRRTALPDGWHVEIEGDTARVVAPPDGPGFTTVAQRSGPLADRLLFALAKALAS